MIRLSDAELQIVMAAAKPIAPRYRDAFLRTIAAELANLGDQLGPGSVARVVRLVQRSFYDPPLGDPDGDSSSPGISRPLRPAR